MSMISVESHINRLFNSVSYRVGNAIVDAGDVWDSFNSLDIILLTHAHFDHIYGLKDFLKINPEVRIYTNSMGKEMLLNSRKNLSLYHETPFQLDSDSNIVVINDGDVVDIGNGLTVKAVYTPGHNASCITWICDDLIFTGDSLIPGVKTVTNLPGSDKHAASDSENLIKTLAVGKNICPGHYLTQPQ